MEIPHSFILFSSKSSFPLVRIKTFEKLQVFMLLNCFFNKGSSESCPENGIPSPTDLLILDSVVISNH